MDAQAAACGFAGYVDQHVTFPPAGPLPFPSGGGTRGCGLWNEIFKAATLVNPAFNIYRIFDTVSPDDAFAEEYITDNK